MELEQLIALETEHTLWSVSVRGVHLWSLVRYTILSHTVARLLQYDYTTSTSYRRRTVRDLQRYAKGMTLFSPFKTQHDALFFVTDLGRLSRDGIHSHDRIHDVYFGMFKRPLIIELSFTPQTPLPDARFERHLYPYTVLSLASRFGQSKLSAQEAQTVRDFVAHIVEIYDVPAMRDDLTTSITVALQRADNWRRLIAFAVARHIKQSPTSSRFALVENASYMGQQGIITQTLHDHGFRAFEAQHGLLSAHHPAYHLPREILDDPAHPARAYLPDVFLTYGEYWSSQAQIPAEKFVVGSPQIAETLRTVSGSAAPNPSQVLVISGDNRALDTAKRLVDALPEYQIVFKLHPLEFARFDELSAQLKAPNLRIVGKASIYDLIAQSGVIVGHASTAVVEAAAFPNKRIFYFEPAFIPAEVGTRFVDDYSLVSQILDPAQGHPAAKPDDFWALNIDERLATFAQKYLR